MTEARKMIAIIDYQMGNLRSVQKGFESVGADAHIVDKPADLANADKVVLPGVGAFRDAIHELNHRGWVEPIKDVVESGKPMLGICLGLQLLFDVSFEDGEYEGLGILPGKVVRFDLPPQYKVPHMGWNQGAIKKESPLFDGIKNHSHFYFVHSYFVEPEDSDVVAIEADYHVPFCAAIMRENLFATQFHPEKSQKNGLQLLKNFSSLS